MDDKNVKAKVAKHCAAKRVVDENVKDAVYYHAKVAAFTAADAMVRKVAARR